MVDNAAQHLEGAAERMRGVLDDPMAAPKEEIQEESTEEIQAEPEAQAEEEAETTEETETEEATQDGAELGAESVELGADDFAGLLGLDEEKINITDDGKISFKGHVDGQDIDVNLNDLINAYQGDVNLTNRSKQIAELEKQRTNEIQQFQSRATEQAQKAAVTLEAINNQYLQEYNAIDWNGLKAEDPAAWSAKTVEMQQKKAQLDSLVSQTLADINAQQATIDAENQTLQTERLANEQKNMQQAFKALNVKVDDDLQKNVVDYLTSQFDESEMQQLVDHRFMLMAYKAAQFDKGRATAESKKVKKLPKVLKKGAKPSEKAVKLNENKKLHANLKKSGSTDDAAVLIKQRLKQE